MARIAEILASAAATTQVLRQASDEAEFRRHWSAAAAEIGWAPVNQARTRINMSPAPAAPAPKPKISEAERRERRYQRAKYSAYFGGPEGDGQPFRQSQPWRARPIHPANIDPVDPVEADG